MNYYLELKREAIKEDNSRTIAIDNSGNRIKLVSDKAVINSVNGVINSVNGVKRNNNLWDVVSREFVDSELCNNRSHAQAYKNIERKFNDEKHDLGDANLEKVFNNVVEEYKKRDCKEIVLESESVMPTPSLDRADRLYVVGMTGSGKSYWIREWVKLLRKAKPSIKIYLFSDVEYDKELAELGAVRILLNEALIGNPIETQELANSVCIFDDIDSIMNKKIKDSVYLTISAILKKGSSKDDIYLVVSNHQLLQYQYSRDLILNSNFIIWFAGNNFDKQLERTSLPREQVKKTKSLKSRYICFHKSIPQYIVYSYGAYLI